MCEESISRRKCTMKKLVLIAVVTVVALALTGFCGMQDMHGGGRVGLLTVWLGDPDDTSSKLGELGYASIGLNFNCNDNTNEVHGTLTWNDRANGVQFTARVPWTAVEDFFPDDSATTCAELAEEAAKDKVSTGYAMIDAQGQEIGTARVDVVQPLEGHIVCSSLPTVWVWRYPSTSTVPDYAAVGCLLDGNITVQ